MNTTMNEPKKRDSKSESAWAPPVSKIVVTDIPAGATNINVDGRAPASPLQGFGQMWQKTFQVRMPGINYSPNQVMQTWKENFPKFQPSENRFYPSMTGITPGAVVFISAKVPPLPGMPSILPVSTGVMVLYADDESFTVMCPQGHPLSGWNTFRVFEEDSVVIAEVKEQSRASDPMYEFFNRYLGSSTQQDNIWRHVLTSLAAHFGVQAPVSYEKVLIDPRLQWSEAKNIWQNAAIRTVFYALSAPLRWLRS